VRQLVLDLRPDAPPTLANFVVGRNAELVAALHEAAARPGQLYLWGPGGSGRSHLLRAAVAAATAAGRPGFYVGAVQAADKLPQTRDALLAIDDIDALDAGAQIALFNAFNRARTNRQTLLVAGTTAPLRLAVREDLRTRIGQCLIYELRPLDDEARAAILRTLAERRGLRLADELVDFLLRHGRRDLPSLLAVLEAIDRASLERKRAVTLPLLRELMQRGLEI
jgi:DnaA family protein